MYYYVKGRLQAHDPTFVYTNMGTNDGKEILRTVTMKSYLGGEVEHFFLCTSLSVVF